MGHAPFLGSHTDNGSLFAIRSHVQNGSHIYQSSCVSLGPRQAFNYVGTGPSTIAPNKLLLNRLRILLHAPSAMATIPLRSSFVS